MARKSPSTTLEMQVRTTLQLQTFKKISISIWEVYGKDLEGQQKRPASFPKTTNELLCDLKQNHFSAPSFCFPPHWVYLDWECFRDRDCLSLSIYRVSDTASPWSCRGPTDAIALQKNNNSDKQVVTKLGKLQEGLNLLVRSFCWFFFLCWRVYYDSRF